MYFGLNERTVDRISLLASVLALLAATMLCYEGIYPYSMVADFSGGIIFALTYMARKKLSTDMRMVIITLSGSLIGITAIVQTPLYANGFMVLGGVMLLSFASWSGWRAWLIPLLAIVLVAAVALGVSLGYIEFAQDTVISQNSVAIWMITAFTIGLLAFAFSNILNDLKKRLQTQLQYLQQSNQRLFLAAYTDPTTGLSNRHRLESIIKKALSEQQTGCLLFIDLVNFRRFNAVNGHAQGDKVLKEIGAFISHLAPANYLVASSQGALFGIWMPNNEVQQAIGFYNQFRERFKTTYPEFNSMTLQAGLAASKPGMQMPELLRNVAAAMDTARQNKLSECCVFTPQMAEHIQQSHDLKMAVRHALDAGHFYPVYQTKVNSRSGQICGVEGLARMRMDAMQTPPAPEDFIPVIHHEGWMTEFGHLMLNAILADIPQLLQRYGEDIKVSINISPPLFLAAEFFPMFSAALTQHGVRPQNVVIEITEEVFASSMQDIIQITSQIQALGAEVSLDDFGAGFSSLSYLHQVYFDEIKIDRSFVTRITEDEKSKILLSAITRLGQALGSRMVTEGVENYAQLDIVQQAGCEIIQGYYYSQPQTLPQLA
ncbi:MAG: EAL domain-containing protein [Oceanospirillaceae bacterium]|nr:EAL domain-containing protein [Oceanospirillaceae bacterium]